MVRDFDDSILIYYALKENCVIRDGELTEKQLTVLLDYLLSVLGEQNYFRYQRRDNIEFTSLQLPSFLCVAE
jgi:hypothetical protein